MHRHLLTGLLATLVTTGTNAQSPQQRSEPPMWLLAFDASVYHALGGPGPMGGGVSIVAEQPINSMLGLRGSLSGMGTWAPGDDVSLCRWLPSGECLVDVVPAQVWSLNASLVSRLYPRGLLFAMIGAGAALPNGARERGRSSVDSSATARLSGHAGLEVAFGRSVNMPRIRIVRTRYWGNMYSMKGHTVISFMLRVL